MRLHGKIRPGMGEDNPIDGGRAATVLFADVSGSTKLYEAAGDAIALETINRMIADMRRATEAAGGRVVKTIGDEVMALFPSAPAAAAAASQIQMQADMLPIVAGMKLGVRIGFHAGPVIQRDNDVFGDTVNMAARLVAQATKDQIITSDETARHLGDSYKERLRGLYAITVKGKADDIGLCELMWRFDGATTVILRPKGVAAAKPKTVMIRLKYRGKEIVRRRDNDSVSLGRDESSGMVIAEDKCSRHHCTVERRGDHFVLKDHSTNGTYVTIGEEDEVLLQRAEMPLRKRGWISFGQTRIGQHESVEFFCD
jgi:class 3 adenylate cyclase